MPEAESIRWTCACGKSLKAPMSAAGKGFTCANCGAKGSVPSKSQSASIIETVDFVKLLGRPIQPAPAKPAPDISLDDGFGDEPLEVDHEPPQVSKLQTIPPMKPPVAATEKRRRADIPMTRTQGAWAIALLFALVTTNVFPLFGFHRPREYRMIAPSDSMLDEDLHQAGKAGWQVVSARRVTGDVSGPKYELILMR